jgi:hypothetical protein
MVVHKATMLVASACIALAGCSSYAGSGVPASTTGSETNAARHGWILPAAKKMKLLYVTDYTSSIVLIYKQGATGSGPVGEITDGIDNPQGDAVDKSGTLYVANEGNNTVTEYLAGSLNPSVTLSTDISRPLDVSVDSNDIVYITEGSAGKILEFKPGSTSPDATVTISHPSDATNAKDDDLYVSYNESSAGHVARCAPLASSCTDLGISVGLAQGIAIDLHGNLLLGDVYGFVIDIYKRGQTSPFRTIAVPEEEPAKLALDKKDATLYQADPANFAVELFDYGAGTQESSFTFGSADELEGVGLSPGQKPGK